MPIRQTRRVTTGSRKTAGTRIAFSVAALAIVAVTVFTVLVASSSAATTGTSVGASSADSSSTAIAHATTSGTTTSADDSTSGATIQTGTVSGDEKVYVSVVETTPQTSDDVNTDMTQAAVQTVIDHLNSYWSAQSNGKVTVELGGYETRSLDESTCSPNDALQSEETNAFGGMFANDAWKGTHNHLLVLSAESCNADSFATVGGTGGEIFSGNGTNDTTGVEYLLHEFGHNLGFEHADASICANTTSYDGTAADFSLNSTVCPTREYDDYFDIMGYTVKNATPNLSSPQRIMAGWLTNYDTLTNATSTVTEKLTSLSLATSGTQALKIVDPTSGDEYYVEYRTDAGLDKTSAEFNYGLQCDPKVSGYTICELDSNKSTGDIRILRFIPFADTHANGTTVLATGLTSGSTDKTKRHTHLDSGDTFTSVDAGFTLKVNSMSPTSGASITVTFPSASSSTSSTATPVATTTGVTLKHSSVSHGATDTVHVTVSRADDAHATGSVELLINGKKIKSYKLTSSDKGAVKFSTPALKHAGSNSIQVVYTGTGTTTSNATAKVTVR